MRDSDVIDRLYDALVYEASHSDYDFNTLLSNWSWRGSSVYNEKKSLFIRNIMRLASRSPILFGSGSFWMFDGKIYVSIREELLYAAYSQFLLYIGLMSMIDDRNVFRKYFSDTIRFRNVLEVRHDIVAFSNGVLTLEDGGFHPFDPCYHVTYYHPYPYEPRARCPRWQSFLREVLPDRNSRITLQMYLGLGLIERGVSYNACEGKERGKVELCLILIGGGSNGKSVIYETALGVFGKERISGIDYDELTAAGDEGMRARRLLRGALFNWSSDSDSRTFGRRRSGVFKRIVSSESVTDRAIGHDVSENANMPYLIFNLNDLPFPDDASLGFIRRLQFVSFDVTIPPEHQNKALASELVKEYPGIFNWIMRGSRELRRRKFVFPPSEGGRRQILLSQLNIDPVLSWVNSFQLRSAPSVRGEIGIEIPAKVLLASLEQFCDDNDAAMVSPQSFGRSMGKISGGFLKHRCAEGVRYLIYGCSEERLSRHFIIRNEDMRVADVTEDTTYLSPDD